MTVHPSTNISQKSLNEDLIDLRYKRQEALEQAKAALSLAVERMKWYYDQKVQKVLFKVGDKVLLMLWQPLITMTNDNINE